MTDDPSCVDPIADSDSDGSLTSPPNGKRTKYRSSFTPLKRFKPVGGGAVTVPTTSPPDDIPPDIQHYMSTINVTVSDYISQQFLVRGSPSYKILKVTRGLQTLKCP